MKRLLTLLAITLWPGISLWRPTESQCSEAAKKVDYLADVKPLLAKNCYSCHGAKQQKGGLRLDTAAAMLKGGDGGPAFVAGKSADSLLIKAVKGIDDVTQMPLKKEPLSAPQIGLLTAWIDQGAKSPEKELPEDSPEAARNHWSFRPIAKASPPEVKNPAWVRNPIDRFILARLEKEGVKPSPEADRATLIRRLSLDLLGLPPSVQEVDEFLADKRPDACERLVDRLLQSPHHGERWGRHWLDLARYADSNGFSIDAAREIWKYRDWVIEAINKDMPFDQFTIEQLAADLLPKPATNQLVATGFHRNTLLNQEGGIDLEQFRVEAVVDRVNTTGSVWLGLTIACAQCHDHKFDPIRQSEYYQLFAFFNNADDSTLSLATPEETTKRDAIRKQIDVLEKDLHEYETKWRKGLTDAQFKEIKPEVTAVLGLNLNQRTERQKKILLNYFAQQSPGFKEWAVTLNDLKKREPKFPTAMVLSERVKPRESHVHINGDFTRKGERVQPGVPAVLPGLEIVAPPTRDAKALNRLDLARWLVDPKNPLTARVAVNRFWQQYFGAGLVETSNDFGTQGASPTHPELLDWLATEFMAKGWSMKAMHRLIVTSAAYRQSSRVRDELRVKDPNNKFLARQTRLRLEAEVVRDTALAASGLLSRKIGGPSVFPPQPEGVYQLTQVPKDWKASPGADRFRRGMYTHFWRSAPHPQLMVFDSPDASSTCTRRNRSNTPLQALTLLNDQAFFEFAQSLAARVLTETKSNDSDRLRHVFRLCFAREPSGKEKEVLNKVLAQQQADFEKNPGEAKLLLPEKMPPKVDGKQLAAWTATARVLLNLDEFITRE